ncbi:helix-hairpin-helix domain-containing protein [Prevotella sp. HUN102]|uniref:helix-hairpin-helix domain-containing protein n=1 Tax=Prevotella sp. HUN102 TaxID=1392486 RepID=UPI000490DF99|nr:helix-hairpin-helix domain-containing protein [Prevotella sp. HUN102]
MKIQEFFYLQKSDRKVVVFIIFLAVAALTGVYFLGKSNGTGVMDGQDSIVNATNNGKLPDGDVPAMEYYETESGRQAELFPFDPNTADSIELKRLGLLYWQIRNIYKYRSKGGIYRSPQDFARLYGLTRKQYLALEPYIVISDDFLPASSLASVQAYHEQKVAERQRAHEAYEQYKKEDAYKPYKEYDRDTIRYPLKIKVGEHINLATADTTMLKKVPGIGSGWAKAIVNYGQRLGGYVEVGQLKEIEGFPEEALPYFEVRNAHTQKINVNKLSLSQLRKHPYINFYQARHIMDYRRLKGNLTSLQQLHLLKDFPPEAIKRLEPYVSY